MQDITGFMLTSGLSMGHGFVVADIYKHGRTHSHLPSIQGQFVLCGCKAAILDRQATRVCSLLRPRRAFGIRSTLLSYGYSAFTMIKFASTAGGLLAGARSNKPPMEPTRTPFSKLQYPVQEGLLPGSAGPLGLQLAPELPHAVGSESLAWNYPKMLRKIST